MRKIALAVLLASCCHVKPARPSQVESCVSACGMLFEGVPNGAVSCEDLQEIEDVTRAAMDRDHCADDARMCKSMSCGELFGYQVIAEDADAIVWIHGMNILGPFVGVTDTASKTITVANSEDWRHGSLSHEMVHAMQNGTPLPNWIETDHEAGLNGGGGHGHSGWTEHGVYKTLEDIQEGRQ